MNDWKEATWIEAANAFAAGTHEAQWITGGANRWYGTKTFNSGDKYRIREMLRTITVTIPRPDHVDSGCSPYPLNLLVLFSKEAERETAYDAIRVAMEQQQ